MSELYWASAEVLVTAARLASDRDLPAPDELSTRILAALQRMVQGCRAAGVPDAETAEARYAIVAFIDERILESNWPGRAEWMRNPLQLRLYREFTAGENFFARARALLNRPQTAMALEVYYLCLALGFTGAAASGSSGAQNAQSYRDAIRARLPRADPRAPIGPHALPADLHSFAAPRRPLGLALSLACAFVVALGLGLLGWSLDSALERTDRDLASVQVAPSQAPVRR